MLASVRLRKPGSNDPACGVRVMPDLPTIKSQLLEVARTTMLSTQEAFAVAYSIRTIDDSLLEELWISVSVVDRVNPFVRTPHGDQCLFRLSRRG